MSMPAKFDRLARAYLWMEYFSFGPYLRICREFRISDIADRRRALIYGDGDGRFLAELVRRTPEIRCTAVDASGTMLKQLSRRLPPGSRVRLVHADALECKPENFPDAPFDLVVSHFFLDCFSDAEIASLVATTNVAVSDAALWVMSDFAIPRRTQGRLIGKWIVRALYLAFGLLTGLKTRRLPDHARVLRDAGWLLEDRKELLLGLLISERWRRCMS